MSMLTAALLNSWIIFILFGLLIWLPTLAVRKNKKGIAVLGLVNNGGLIGLAAFLALPLFSPFPLAPITLALAILIEIFCALLFYVSAHKTINFLQHRAFSLSTKTIWLFIVVKIFFFIINYKASGGQYGIFSGDSRIDFLNISPTISKIHYVEELIDTVLVFGSWLHFARRGKIRYQDLVGFASVIFFGFLTGSKGASLLRMAYAALFTYAAFPQAFSSYSYKTIFTIITLGTGLVGGYLYTLSQVIGIPFVDLLSLSLSRFILSADARIMAFDPRVTGYVLTQPHGTLLAELFRGFSRLAGQQVAEFPIGVYQYQAEVGTSNYVGATNQLSAMFVVFGGQFWILEIAILSILILLVCSYFFTFLRDRDQGVSWTAMASLYGLVTSFCQGFDAFAQLLPIAVLAVGLMKVYSRIKESCAVMPVGSS